MSILTLRSRFLLIVSLALTGCMSGPAVKGSNLLVTPVNYVYKVDIKNNKLTPAKHELYAYLESNKYALQVHGATIYWQGKEGKSLAVLARNWLLKQGTPSPKARVLLEADGKGSSVKISTTVHQVQTLIVDIPSSANIITKKMVVAKMHCVGNQWCIPKENYQARSACHSRRPALNKLRSENVRFR